MNAILIRAEHKPTPQDDGSAARAFHCSVRVRFFRCEAPLFSTFTQVGDCFARHIGNVTSCLRQPEQTTSPVSAAMPIKRTWGLPFKAHLRRAG